MTASLQVLVLAFMAPAQERVNIPPAELPAHVSELVRKFVPAGSVTEVTRRVRGAEEEYGVRIFVSGKIVEAEFEIESGLPPEGEVEEPVSGAELPPSVAEAFRKAVPGTEIPRGRRTTEIDEERPDGEVTYVWKLKDPSRRVEISGDARTVRVRRRIADTELPAAVREALARDYAGARLEDVDEIVLNGATTYEIEIAGGEDLIATSDGRITVED